MTETNNPIMASVVETPKRPRLYIIVCPTKDVDGARDASLAYESIAEAECMSGLSPGDTVFALPGTDDVWTREKIEEAARKLCDRTGWPPHEGYINALVLFALDYLGLGEQT